VNTGGQLPSRVARIPLWKDGFSLKLDAQRFLAMVSFVDKPTSMTSEPVRKPNSCTASLATRGRGAQTSNVDHAGAAFGITPAPHAQFETTFALARTNANLTFAFFDDDDTECGNQFFNAQCSKQRDLFWQCNLNKC